MKRLLIMLAIIVLTATTVPLAAQEYTPDKDSIVEAHSQKQFSPYVGREYPANFYWGDTHLHTAISVDAGTMCRVGQEDAYRFARGEEITTTQGCEPSSLAP